jgi:2-dehydro-3-deoxygluconokinase
MIDWPRVFEGKQWFHLTGITPALSPSCAKVALESVKAAKQAGLTVSCDLNYRKKLWTPEEAKQIMSELVQFVDVVIGNEEDAEKVFGIREEGVDVEKGLLDVAKYRTIAGEVQKLSGARKVAITLRESLSASDNNWSALLLDGAELHVSRKYPLHIVDRVGGGDSFAAGLIHGLLSGWESQKALEFAVAASALKHTIPGDMNVVSEAEVMSIVEGNLSGRVQR